MYEPANQFETSRKRGGCGDYRRGRRTALGGLFCAAIAQPEDEEQVLEPQGAIPDFNLHRFDEIGDIPWRQVVLEYRLDVCQRFLMIRRQADRP